MTQYKWTTRAKRNHFKKTGGYNSRGERSAIHAEERGRGYGPVLGWREDVARQRGHYPDGSWY